MEYLKARTPGEGPFHQAASEVVASIVPILDRHPVLVREKIFERICEPERVIEWRIPWVDAKVRSMSTAATV